MTPQTKRIVLTALSHYRGDDYERAKSAFQYCTMTQMQQEHGASGQTRQQLLDGYKDHVDAVQQAITEVSGL